MSPQPLNPSNNKELEFSGWRELLRLGELLLDQPTINKQLSCIINSYERLFLSKVQMWIAESFFNVIRNETLIVDNISTNVLSDLMKQARDKKHFILDINSSVIALPLIIHEEIFGVLQLDKENGSTFNDEEIEFIVGLALQSSIALAGFRQKEVEHRQIELLTLVKKVSAQINNVFDFEQITSQVTKLILDTFHYYFIAIFTIDTGQDILRFRASAGPLISNKYINNSNSDKSPNPISENDYPNILVHVGEGIIGYVAKSGVEVLSNDVSADVHYRHTDLLPETKSEFALPLKSGENILGVLDVQSDNLNSFDDTDALVLRALADNIATAIENAYLYNDLQQKIEHLSSIAEISKAVSSILDIDNLLNSIITLIHNRFGFSKVNIFSNHPGKEKLFSRVGISQEGMEPLEYCSDVDINQGPVSWAVTSKTTVLINNLKNDDRFAPLIVVPGTQSELVIPLLFGEKILGALDLCSDSQNAFKQNDVVLFETLADNIAVAIRNADLYRSEQWRRQVAESMKEVVGLLSADVALDEVLDRILIELEKTLPTDISAIWLLDNSDSESGMEQFTSSLHLGAFHLNDRASSDDSKGMTQIHELLGKFDQKEDNINSLLSTFPWITEILESKQAVIREPRSSYEPFGGLLSFSKEYSAIGAPLQINNQTIGLLVLVHHLSGKYGIESQLMTTTFASYAAVAIENTRLFEAAHDQAWVSTVLLQVAEATQSITSLNELLETVVNIIPGLIGINACAIYLWDSTVDVFYPATSFGFDVDHLTELNNWMISQDSISEFNQSLQSRTPIILNSEVSTDEILSQSFSSINFQNDLLIIFPMVAQSSLRGAILVDFNSSTLTKNSTQELWDEKFSIIQGIAHQTAVAVESIQLIEAQEEEAYISVALLQVAQAIVSLNQLDEILGSIVRITPILVGVKRCIIYLWDNNNSIFRLSQSYGFSKADLSLMGQTIGNEDFLFIETIRQKNQVVYHVFIDPLKSPISWKELIPADLHIVEAVLQEDGFQIAGESENEYLKTKSRLLIGFPLSVKGEVLGVMLTEEEDPIKGPPSYHIREKRLEIVKGITQQAAIAIKNELLQKEAVKSERMERELQLAREIQTTFLPERIPDLPGWDVDIRWQPARQVGGDFYDIIELGDNNLGFVIADVADKGMPAALFMTLIRTLIRAAAKDKSSPAAVLKQVNELLIPDAKHGMFVTVFYSVLSLNTGKVLYANAGHNPPILRYYLSEELHELIRTGMALGVMDGIEIEEREVCLRPGDYLLCYTDGVTEAFSVSGEAYGNQRLFDVVSSKNFARSKELLDEIENSINMFIEGAPLSDDLTLAAFFRKNI